MMNGLPQMNGLPNAGSLPPFPGSGGPPVFSQDKPSALADFAVEASRAFLQRLLPTLLQKWIDAGKLQGNADDLVKEAVDLLGVTPAPAQSYPTPGPFVNGPPSVLGGTTAAPTTKSKSNSSSAVKYTDKQQPPPAGRCCRWIATGRSNGVLCPRYCAKNVAKTPEGQTYNMCSACMKTKAGQKLMQEMQDGGGVAPGPAAMAPAPAQASKTKIQATPIANMPGKIVTTQFGGNWVLQGLPTGGALFVGVADSPLDQQQNLDSSKIREPTAQEKDLAKNVGLTIQGMSPMNTPSAAPMAMPAAMPSAPATLPTLPGSAGAPGTSPSLPAGLPGMAPLGSSGAPPVMPGMPPMPGSGGAPSAIPGMPVLPGMAAASGNPSAASGNYPAAPGSSGGGLATLPGMPTIPQAAVPVPAPETGNIQTDD